MKNSKTLKNGKYFIGHYKEKGDFRGWFVGSFFPENHPCKSNQIEALYIENPKGFIEKPHYHKEKIELLLFLEGKAKYKINDEEVELKTGDFLFVDINNVVEGEYLEPSKIFVIHSPSIPTDKKVVDE